MMVTYITHLCFVSDFASSLTLQPVAEASQIWHNLAPNKGLEVKTEIKNMNWWTNELIQYELKHI